MNNSPITVNNIKDIKACDINSQ